MVHVYTYHRTYTSLPLVKVLRHGTIRGRAGGPVGPSISIAEMSPRTEGVITSGLELSDSARFEMSPRAAFALAEKVRRARAGRQPSPYPSPFTTCPIPTLTPTPTPNPPLIPLTLAS